MTRRSKNATRQSAANPAEIKSLFARAVKAIQEHDPATGRKLLDRAHRLAPTNTQILFNLGFAHHLERHFAEAIHCYQRCTELNPGMLPAWLNIADAARQMGKLELAIDAYRRFLDLRPDDPSVHNDIANLLATIGQIDAALTHYQRALELDARRMDTRLNLARVLAGAGRLPQAEKQYRVALESDPAHAPARHALVALLTEQNREDEAEMVLLATPGGIHAVDDLLLAGNLQLRQGRAATAEASYQAILDMQPGHAVALNNLGLICALRGARDDAERLFRRALDSAPNFADPWRNLVALRTYSDADHADIVAMRTLAAQSTLPESASIHLGFALGKALDDCGRYDEAFEHFSRANEARHRQTPFDVAALAEHARRIREVFTHDMVNRNNCGDASELPVYIVGMPRTGSTLLEQMLSAHPAFHGAGELLIINRLIAQLETSAGQEPTAAYPECIAQLGSSTISGLAKAYLGQLRKIECAPAVQRISDKMPYNFFHLGLVHLLFPRSRIIHCRRHPVDACLSAYFNYFPRGLDFTYTMQDLVAVYGIYRTMMSHWREQVGLDILDVSYEELITNPATVLAGVLDHLGLDWDDGVLEFYQRRRDVQTLSAWQVRRPLHADSRERHRHYRSHIAPLIDGLGAYLDS